MTIKEFRQSQGLSQPKLAKALGIGVSTVGGYETGKIKPSANVIAKIREVFGVDLGAAAPAAVEAAPAKKTSKAKMTASVEAAPAPAVEEKKAAPAKKASKAKKAEAAPAPAKKASKTKKAAPVEAATAPAVKKKEAAPAKKTSKAKKAATVAVEEKKEDAPAKKPRAKKEAAPAKTSKPKKAASSKQTAIVIQSPMGGEITTEDILTKVGDVDTVYVRVDQNAIYWIKGEKSGAVNIW